MEVLVPMAGLIDKSAELARLDKELGKLEKECQRLEGKLGNPNFIDKAPAAVVDKDKAKLQDAKMALNKLQSQRLEIEKL
jgi:valyl-tRNA synthetase